MTYLHNHELPEGMSVPDFRKHPVTETLQMAAMGKRGLPSRSELDALELRSSERSALVRECKRVAAIYDSGEHQVARDKANQAASDLLESMGEERRDPNYLTESPEDPHARMTPDELANLVRRM